jgi:small-conductance mechanosensitive channel
MMSFFPDGLRSWSTLAWAWLDRAVLVQDTLVQGVALLVACAIMWFVAAAVSRGLDRGLGHLAPGPFRAVAQAFANAASPVLFLLLLWFATLAADASGLRSDLLRFSESLVLVWVLIRLSSRLVRNEYLARTIAILAWLVAALNIAGLLGPAVALLDAMAVSVGTFRVSLLLLLKGLITLALLVWLANTVSRLAEQRLRGFVPLTPAMQVLAGKLVRITLLTIAVVFALGSIGIDLTAFAVFSGAIGVGVGFGLQKVVSNLVSGVILLMDRSIKPGDVIEVDGTYGSVSALNARYVCVLTRDGKEYLIPNEDLITQRVTNWSYSHDLIRMHVKLGISYQSDPHKAIDLALEAARGVARVMETPQPTCLLVAFGDSTIDFELRFWINDPANGTTNIRSAVMLKIWDLFRENGIEIPSPRRDLTFRNPEALVHAVESLRNTPDRPAAD